MFFFGKRNAELERLAGVVKEGIELAEREMKPGMNVVELQDKLEKLAESYGYFCGHLTGHSIGLDVIERPLIAKPKDINFVGVEVPTDNDKLRTLEEGMVISYHPQIIHPNRVQSAYMSDIFIITENGAERLSKRSHDVIFIDS